MLRFILLLMTLTALLAPVAETLLIQFITRNDLLHELELRCRDSIPDDIKVWNGYMQMNPDDNDNGDLEHHYHASVRFWVNRSSSVEVYKTPAFWEPEQIQFNSTSAQYHYSELYAIEHDSKQPMPKHLNEPWYLHALHATGTRFANAMPYYYYCREADLFQLLAIHNRFSPYTGLELMSVKETYSRWTTKSAIIILYHWYEDSWHHPLCKSGCKASKAYVVCRCKGCFWPLAACI